MPKPLLAITVMFVYALACTSAPAATPTPAPTATGESLALYEYRKNILDLEISVNELADRLLEKLERPNPDSQLWAADVTAMALELQALLGKSELLTKAVSLREFREIDGEWAAQYADVGTVLLIGLNLYESGQTYEGLAVIRTSERALGDIDFQNNR